MKLTLAELRIVRRALGAFLKGERNRLRRIQRGGGAAGQTVEQQEAIIRAAEELRGKLTV